MCVCVCVYIYIYTYIGLTCSSFQARGCKVRRLVPGVPISVGE